MNLKNLIKQSIVLYYNNQDSFSIADWFYDFIDNIDWIEIKDEDGENEQLDLENFEITEVEDDYMIIHCGCNWQSPHKVKFCEKNGKIIAIDLGEHVYPTDGFNDTEFCEKFGLEYDEDTETITNI